MLWAASIWAQGLKYAGNPPSGKENRRTRRMLELRKRKGRL